MNVDTGMSNGHSLVNKSPPESLTERELFSPSSPCGRWSFGLLLCTADQIWASVLCPRSYSLILATALILPSLKTIVPQEPLSLQQIEREIQGAKDRQAETGGEIDYSNLAALLREKLKKFAAFNASFSNVGACLRMTLVFPGWKNSWRITRSC